MKSLFEHDIITYSEYEYFKSLAKSDKIKYMFELYETTLVPQNLNLNMFFETIKSAVLNSKYIPIVEAPKVKQSIIDVTIDDEIIMIETDNLKALRTVLWRFVESGYVLRRELNMEKMFRKNKHTKYIRIFQILNRSSSICPN
jgi:hypothetical protein